MIMLFVAIGCDKSEKPNEIKAKVENASKYRNVVKVKLMVYDRTTSERHGNVNVFTDHYVEIANGKWKNGGFTMEFPKTLAQNHIRPLINSNSPTQIYYKQPTMTINDENVRVVDAYFVGVDKKGNAVAIFSPVKIAENDNTKAFYTYADSDITISGYTKSEGHAIPEHEDAPSWFEETTNYSVEWKKGWNVWSFSSNYTITGYTLIITKQWTTASVSGLKWYGSEEYLHIFQN
jgi:hypothetical protein